MLAPSETGLQTKLLPAAWHCGDNSSHQMRVSTAPCLSRIISVCSASCTTSLSAARSFIWLTPGRREKAEAQEKTCRSQGSPMRALRRRQGRRLLMSYQGAG